MKHILTLATLVFATTCFAQVPDYVPTDGLVAWFDFGLGVEDQAGNLELTLHGGAQLDDGVLDVSESGAWAESSELPSSFEGNPEFSVVAVLQVQMDHNGAASWGVGGGVDSAPATAQNINSWNHNATNQVTLDLWGATTWGSGLEYSQEEFDVAFWSKANGNFSADNILLGLNDQILGGADLFNLRNTANQPVLPAGGKLFLGKAGLEDNYYGPFKIKSFGLFDRALDVEDIQLFRSNLIDALQDCIESSACNFNPLAVFDDGSCVPSGCMDSQACNFNPEAECEGQSCDYSCCPGPGCCLDGQHWDWAQNGCVITSPSDTDFDGCVGMTDLLDLLSVFGTCNEVPWSCGDLLEYQGYDYETVQIGEQCWFAENLRAESYRNGDAMSTNLNNSEWQNTSSGAFAEPMGDSSGLELYGMLYNGYAVLDERALCPSGWNVPSDQQWIAMEIAIGMTPAEANDSGWRGENQGHLLKSQSDWNLEGGDNEVGFSALPGGFRGVSGDFGSDGISAYWWTRSMGDSTLWIRHLRSDESRIYRNANDALSTGFSVRCIQGSE